VDVRVDEAGAEGRAREEGPAEREEERAGEHGCRVVCGCAAGGWCCRWWWMFDVQCEDGVPSVARARVDLAMDFCSCLHIQLKRDIL
jgi:hypothetical protein